MKEGYVHEVMETDGNHPIVGIVQEQVQNVFRKTSKITCFTAWSDGGILSSYGKIPTIVFGAGDLQTAHSAEEHILIDQILPATIIYSLVA